MQIDAWTDSPWRSAYLTLMLTLVAAILPLVIIYAVNETGPPVDSAYHPDRCSRLCHDRERHASTLPDVLTGPGGLLADVTDGLSMLGDTADKDASRGYKLVNLALFAVAWPLVLVVLFGLCVWQRLEIRRRQGGAGD